MKHMKPTHLLAKFIQNHLEYIPFFVLPFFEQSQYFIQADVKYLHKNKCTRYISITKYETTLIFFFFCLYIESILLNDLERN